MGKFFSKIINFLYPLTCSICGNDLNYSLQTNVCDECRRSFPFINGLICQKCGIPLRNGGEYCSVCKKYPEKYSFDKMRSVCLYKGSMRKLILRFKYSNRAFLAKDSGLIMYETMKLYGFYNNVDFVIPVPSNIIRRIKRGYNQAELLANEISHLSGIPLMKNSLFRRKITKPQFKLSKNERVKNVKDSFFVKNNKELVGKTILLVDDIVTTSATVSACSLALKTEGVKKVYVLTLARD